MRNCGVTKNVVCGCSCRHTVCHTENSNHLDQNIGIIRNKRSMLVNDNSLLRNVEYNASQEKKKLSRNSLRDGPIGIKETFRDSSIDMKSRIVGFLKQAKNCVSD